MVGIDHHVVDHGFPTTCSTTTLAATARAGNGSDPSTVHARSHHPKQEEENRKNNAVVAASLSLKTPQDGKQRMDALSSSALEQPLQSEAPPSAPGMMSRGGRMRSQSVASTQPSVETVVVKAKRAASTLWTLLHAKVRVLDFMLWSSV